MKVYGQYRRRGEWLDCYPIVMFKNVGDTVSGRIISVEHYEVLHFESEKPRLTPSGDPVMGVRIDLETKPGDEGSRVTFWCEGKWLTKAVATALHAAGAPDITVGDDLVVTFTGYDGHSKIYEAAYTVAP